MRGGNPNYRAKKASGGFLLIMFVINIAFWQWVFNTKSFFGPCIFAIFSTGFVLSLIENWIKKIK